MNVLTAITIFAAVTCATPIPHDSMKWNVTIICPASSYDLAAQVVVEGLDPNFAGIDMLIDGAVVATILVPTPTNLTQPVEIKTDVDVSAWKLGEEHSITARAFDAAFDEDTHLLLYRVNTTPDSRAYVIYKQKVRPVEPEKPKKTQ